MTQHVQWSLCKWSRMSGTKLVTIARLYWAFWLFWGHASFSTVTQWNLDPNPKPTLLTQKMFNTMYDTQWSGWVKGEGVFYSSICLCSRLPAWIKELGFPSVKPSVFIVRVKQISLGGECNSLSFHVVSHAVSSHCSLCSLPYLLLYLYLYPFLHFSSQAPIAIQQLFSWGLTQTRRPTMWRGSSSASLAPPRQQISPPHGLPCSQLASSGQTEGSSQGNPTQTLCLGLARGPWRAWMV